MDTQPTFAELEYNQKKKTTHRERFLARMDALIPWEELEAEMAPFYPRRGQGRPPYPLAVMLRVHCLQLFYNRSDPGMEDDLYEMESLRRFAGLRLGGCDSGRNHYSQLSPSAGAARPGRDLAQPHQSASGRPRTAPAPRHSRGFHADRGPLLDPE